MGIQFRLGPGDHKPVEDFLSRVSPAVQAKCSLLTPSKQCIGGKPLTA
jgi:hypothetical protein